MRIMHDIYFPQRDQTIGAATRNRVQQDLVGDAEHRRRAADAEREKQHRQQRGALVLQRLAKSEFEIVHGS